jgi:uncharacterized membrane protein
VCIIESDGKFRASNHLFRCTLQVEWPKQNRQLLGLIGGLGFLETAFLTYEKLVVGDLTSLCSVGGLSLRCGDVLNSEYANIFGR